ncbi:AbrB/MazE/SpoVT family DNA-binding domain-containing protein [Bradyrhizobium sp. 61]|uniref:AbrB/MazE/SpoVT family DNA-binding domain-containing protein n=1 Tax=Bradyrhizobium sp. 61 TaxID=2782679 RepID=UPI001FF771B6|nr:AbrB/MazE/SpoVT family DNA-binding domain-containing protein [Bradyrhizobium sp. 61]MCK1274785.1 AbrB/MazE/SpoVT family DNA-binding domain-containing protein [Bradyrhizobium sp. 61]
MNVRFSKWGNSIALRIPTGFARDLHVFDGKGADIQVKGGSLVVTPVEGPVYTLDELLAGITEENLHGEVGTAVAVGNEFS